LIKLGYPLANLGHNIKIPHYNRPNKNCQCFSLLIGFGIFIGMKENPIILHIELGNQSVYDWLKENQYVIFSELIRYSKKLLDENLDMVQAIMVSNLSDNIVFIIKRDNVKLTLDKAMEYFMDMEEYEKCAEIRDLDILIQNLENEATNIKASKSDQRELKVNG
jgi:hypothetical protein